MVWTDLEDLFPHAVGRWWSPIDAGAAKGNDFRCEIRSNFAPGSEISHRLRVRGASNTTTTWSGAT